MKMRLFAASVLVASCLSSAAFAAAGDISAYASVTSSGDGTLAGAFRYDLGNQWQIDAMAGTDISGGAATGSSTTFVGAIKVWYQNFGVKIARNQPVYASTDLEYGILWRQEAAINSNLFAGISLSLIEFDPQSAAQFLEGFDVYFGFKLGNISNFQFM